MLSAGQLYAASVTLHNHDKNHALYVYVKRQATLKGILTDKEQLLRPLENFTYSVSGLGDYGKLKEISVCPVNKDITSLDELKKQENVEKLREGVKDKDLYLTLGDGDYDVSFDYDTNNKPKLMRGKAGFPKPFNFLLISDAHPIAKSEAELKKMNMKNYGGDEKREGALIHHREKVALRDKMVEYITDPTKNIYAVIMPGDMAGGYGKKSDTEAFKSIWYYPIKEAFKKYGGNIWVGVGNHDCYWSSLFEPKPTKMLRFLKDEYGSYLYSFYIGNVLFINLGLHPAIKPSEVAEKSSVKELGQSMEFLKKTLSDVKDKNTPIVIFFHYPTQGSYSDWWPQEDKDAFYNTIKNYNVILILAGHSHGGTIYKFRDRFPMVRAAGVEFAEIKFDPKKPHEADIIFVNAQGKTHAKHVETAPEKVKTKKLKPSPIGGIDLTEEVKKAQEGKLED